MGGSFSFRDWYAANGETLNATRRGRYASDPDYRDRVLEINRESRRRRKEAKPRELKKIAPPSYTIAEVNGADEALFTIAAVAKEVGCSIQTIRLWERQGVIPLAGLRLGDGPNARRAYTRAMIEEIQAIVRDQGRLSKDHVVPEGHTESLRVRYANGTEEEVHFAPVNVLARALGFSVAEITSLEKQGAIPMTPLRSPKTKHRLYTVEMIRKAVDVFESFESGKGPTSNAEWQEFKTALAKAWGRSKVAAAVFV